MPPNEFQRSYIVRSGPFTSTHLFFSDDYTLHLNALADMIDRTWPRKQSREKIGPSEAAGRYGVLFDRLQSLAPKTDAQRVLCLKCDLPDGFSSPAFVRPRYSAAVFLGAPGALRFAVAGAAAGSSAPPKLNSEDSGALSLTPPV